MAIPAGAPVAEQPMDPSDLVEFVGRFAPEDSPLLAVGELIDSILDISVLPDAAALGFTILEGTVEGHNRGPFIADDTMVEVWCEVDEAHRADAAYTAGASLGIQITVQTDEEPPRRYQRTMVVEARQQ